MVSKKLTIVVTIVASGIIGIFALAAVFFTGAGIMTENEELKKAGEDYKGTAIALAIVIPSIGAGSAITVAALKRRNRF